MNIFLYYRYNIIFSEFLKNKQKINNLPAQFLKAGKDVIR